jgi:hypothetical protein
MATQQVTFNLSDEIVQKARAAGLLNADRVEDLLRRELDRQAKVDRFFGAADRLAALNTEQPMTMEEIQAEIDAYRAEKRARNARNA